MPLVADLLMGAAYADAHFDGREGDAVRAKLRSFLELDRLPPEIEARLEAFAPDHFNMPATAADLTMETRERRRRVLELVAAIHDADEELDLDEDTYLNDLALALGFKESEYADLKLEIVSVEKARQSIHALAVPPPLPED
jgi:hypothetical protein